jgi:hypothetical protein
LAAFPESLTQNGEWQMELLDEAKKPVFRIRLVAESLGQATPRWAMVATADRRFNHSRTSYRDFPSSMGVVVVRGRALRAATRENRTILGSPTVLRLSQIWNCE